MKKLNKILLMILTLSVVTIYGQASDKYSSSVTQNKYKIAVNSNDKLTKGNNKINVRITHKGHVVHNAKVTFRIYESDENIVKYNNTTTNKNGYYSFDINLPKNDKYDYTVSFNRNGGVIRKLRGSFEI